MAGSHINESVVETRCRVDLWPGSFSPELLDDKARSRLGPFLFVQNVGSHVCSISHVEHKWLLALCKRRKGPRPECAESLSSSGEELPGRRATARMLVSHFHPTSDSDVQKYIGNPRMSTALPQTVASPQPLPLLHTSFQRRWCSLCPALSFSGHLHMANESVLSGTRGGRRVPSCPNGAWPDAPLTPPHGP